MSFFDSISQALGTDGGNSGLLPSVSNALGTDGSKNGLLNDPISIAAAAAAAAYFSGGLSLAGESAVGVADAAAGTAAASSAGAALVPLEVMAPLGSSAVASVTAGTVADAAAGGGFLSWLGSVATPTNLLAGAKLATTLSGAGTPKAAPMYSMPLYGFSGAAPSRNVGGYLPNSANPYGTPQAASGNAGGYQGLAMAALAAVLLAKIFKV